MRHDRPMAVCAASALIALITACNASTEPAAGLVAGSWVTQCPAAQPGCTPAVALNLIQSSNDSVFGEGTITLVYPSGPGSSGRIDNVRQFQAVVRGNRLTGAVQVHRSTAPDFRPDSAWGSITATLTGSGESRTLQATVSIPATSRHQGYEAVGTLLPSS